MPPQESQIEVLEPNGTASDIDLKSPVQSEVHELRLHTGSHSSESVTANGSLPVVNGNFKSIDLAAVLERLASLETKYSELHSKTHPSAPSVSVAGEPTPEEKYVSDHRYGRYRSRPRSYSPVSPRPVHDYGARSRSRSPPPPLPVLFEEEFKLKEPIIRVKSEDWTSTKEVLNISSAKSALIVSMCRQTNHGLISQTIEHTKSVKEAICATDQDSTKNDFSGRVPDRVAIGCSGLLDEIQKIVRSPLSSTETVILTPFKSLIMYHEEFKESLNSEIEKKEKFEIEKTELEAKQAASKKDEEDRPQTAHAEEPTSGDTEVPNVDVTSAMEEVKVFADNEPENLETKTDDKPAEEVDVGPESGFNYSDENRLIEVENLLKANAILINGLKALLHFLDIDLKVMRDLRAKIADATLQEIAFDDLWHLYKPGDVVVSSDQKQAYRVMHITGGRIFRELVPVEGKTTFANRIRKSNFTLDCMYIDFNGREFGPTPKEISIAPYSDTRQILALEVYPISILGKEKAQALEDKLVARGKKFMKLARVEHKRYTGLSIKEGSLRYEEIDSDVMIDFALGYKNSYKEGEGYEIEVPSFDGGVILDATVADSKENEAISGCTVPGCTCISIRNADDTQFELRRRNAFLEDSELLEHRTLERNKHDKEKRMDRDRDRLMLLPIRVIGYVFLNRRWYPLDIENVHDLEEKRPEERDGFADLVLPDGHKDIVRALVKTFAKPARTGTSDTKVPESPQHNLDVVRGKGKGLIILLHGVPGVGKTSTAECVAASTRRPLFPITCGDIGARTAKEVETNLESYFELAHKWGCVLLLDEADVFLGERTKGDIVQNSLVSVFLRVLEYYKGILILTTNRVGEFDEAIKSRIHIALYYPELDYSSTMQIWDNNLENIRSNTKRPIYFSKKDIKGFARKHWQDAEKLTSKPHWNGRQIKNAFQTAIALAEWDHKAAIDSKKREKNSPPILESRHFETVQAASAKFDTYLTTARGKTYGASAKEKGIRRDDINAKGEVTKQTPSSEYKNRRKPGGHIREESAVDLHSDSSEITEDTDEEFEARTSKEKEERLKEENERKARDEKEKRERKEQRARKKREKELKEVEKKVAVTKDSDGGRTSDDSYSD